MHRIVFFGSSTFAVPILERLVHDPRFEIVGVITQPNRPAGRRGVLTPTPIAVAADNLGLTATSFETVKSNAAGEFLQTTTSDVAVVASFGQIIPSRALLMPSHGMINVHPSLLPLYRGATPIPATIAHGDEQTGVTFMRMDALMDHGDVLAQFHTTVAPDETTFTLDQKLSLLAATHVGDVLVAYLAGQLAPHAQDHERATCTTILTRDDGLVDWKMPASAIERRVRAYDPWPGTWTVIETYRLKILRARLGEATMLGAGTWTVVHAVPGIACGDGRLLMLEEVQQEGRKPMDGASFLRGRRALPRTESMP